MRWFPLVFAFNFPSVSMFDGSIRWRCSIRRRLCWAPSSLHCTACDMEHFMGWVFGAATLWRISGGIGVEGRILAFLASVEGG